MAALPNRFAALALKPESFDEVEEQGSGVRGRTSDVRVRVRAPALPIESFIEEIVIDDTEAPTLRPPAITETAITELAPIHELLYRFDVGDHRGALAAAESLLDRSLVPVIVAENVSKMGLDTVPSLLLSCVDGNASLEQILESAHEQCGLPMLDALRALCDLLDARVIALRP